jgi:hypothetical protein
MACCARAAIDHRNGTADSSDAIPPSHAPLVHNPPCNQNTARRAWRCGLFRYLRIKTPINRSCSAGRDPLEPSSSCRQHPNKLSRLAAAPRTGGLCRQQQSLCDSPDIANLIGWYFGKQRPHRPGRVRAHNEYLRVAGVAVGGLGSSFGRTDP